MASIIKCNKCGNEIEVSEALSKELEEKILQETKDKHHNEVQALLKKQENLEQQRKLEVEKLEKLRKHEQEQLETQKKQEIENLQKEISEKARKEAIEKVRRDYDAKIISTKEESEEISRQNKKLQKEITNLFKQLRESKNVEGELKIKYEKQLLEEQEKIKVAAIKEAQNESSLKIAQKDKQLEDLQKQLQEAQRRAQQGSQQLQGEMLEIQLEDLIKKHFPDDEIEEVPKGIKGADIVQTVHNKLGMNCGKIIWESKNTKNWSKSWVTKLVDDQRALKADLALLVTNVLPEGIESFGLVDKVWVSNIKSSIGLVSALRQQLIGINVVKEMNKGKSTKAEVVYNYLTSNDFKQRIEVWVEYFLNKQQEIQKERMYFNKKWEKEEKEIQKIVQNTAGIYGDLQGLIGSALPKIKHLELPD